MAAQHESVELLVAEYETLIEEARIAPGSREIQRARLIRVLEFSGAWSPDGASEIVALAVKHGSFVLRNALALACALQIEDGEAKL